jgi:hypothetical protein
MREGDYSRWFRDIIKDETLAERVDKLRNNGKVSAKESRAEIFDYIRKVYEKEA